MGIDFRRPLNPFGIRFGEALVWTKNGSTPPPEEKYTVAISLTNPQYWPEPWFKEADIYEILDDQVDEIGRYKNIEQIGVITEPDGSETVQISKTSYGILLVFFSNMGDIWWNDSDVTCSSDITYISERPEHNDAPFHVVGDGTIVMDNIYFDD